MLNRPIFVVGMPRSGTTVLRSLLDAHPTMAVAPETHFLDRWLKRISEDELATPDGFERFWSAFTSSRDFTVLNLDPADVRGRVEAAGPLSAKAIFSELLERYAEAAGKVRSGEKTPGHYRHLDQLFGWYPDAQVLFLRRDPRAVAASWTANDEDWTDQPVDVIIARWRRSIEIAERWARRGRTRLVDYERLVAAPESELAEICAWLGEDFEPHVLTGERHAPADSQSSPSRGEVSTGSLERWRERLSEEEIAVIEYLGRDAMRRLGYEPSGARLSPARKLALEVAAAGRRGRAVVLAKLRR